MKTENWNFITDLLLDDSFISHVTDSSLSHQYVETLKKEYPDKKKEIEIALNIMKGMKSEDKSYSMEHKRAMWDRITEKAALTNKKRRKSITLFIGIAATVLLIIGLGISSVFYFTGNEKIEQYALKFSSGISTPGLILSDGQQLPIQGEQPTITYLENGSKLIIDGSLKVQKTVPREDAYNQLIAPYGKTITLTLSDGTRVWVSSGSRLIYPPSFNRKVREIYLDGEAYFEVASVKNKPFIVKTEKMDTRVLGTKFYVQAYAKENKYSTLLLEGKVMLSEKKGKSNHEVTLKPGQQGYVNQNQNDIRINEVDNPENEISWIHGYFRLENERLDQLLDRIAKYYNVKITLPESLTPMIISGKLDLKENPETVLNDIAVLANLELTQEEKKYFFKKMK